MSFGFAKSNAVKCIDSQAKSIERLVENSTGKERKSYENVLEMYSVLSRRLSVCETLKSVSDLLKDSLRTILLPGAAESELYSYHGGVFRISWRTLNGFTSMEVESVYMKWIVREVYEIVFNIDLG